ncbi:MAG: hypothetical protein AB8B69_19710 [Chitinophagales bacterium]
MRKYIVENKFDELKKALKKSNLEVFRILANALDKRETEYKEISFNTNLYEQEWMEGIAVYLALDESEIEKKALEIYRKGLVGIVFKIHHFIRESAIEVTDSGTHFKEDFYINPQLRVDLQAIIDLWKKQKFFKSVLNMVVAKAQLSTVMNHRIERFEIGRDMLQCAGGYEELDYKENAVQMYQAILHDFECESVKLSSGLFPQVSYVDTRPMEEIEVFEKAKERYEALTGKIIREPNRVHVNSDESAKELETKIENNKEDESEVEGKTGVKEIREEKTILLQSNGFTIGGYKTPAFTLREGEMLRIWVEIVPHSTKNPDGYWTAKQMQETIERMSFDKKEVKACPNKVKRGFVDWLKPISVENYAKKHFGWSPKEIDRNLSPLGIKPTYLLKNLGVAHQKVFAIVCGFQEDSIPCFDYYGLSPDSTKGLTNYVKRELKKGRSAIAFDNLSYKTANPDSDRIMNVVVRGEESSE